MNKGIGTDIINGYNGGLDVFTTEKFCDGIFQDVDVKTIQQWLSNPDMYREKLNKYSIYQYITDGDIFQLYDLIKILPNLEYTINCLKTNKNDTNNTLLCRRVLKNIDHKELTRDILSQTLTEGTLCGLWVGKESNTSKEDPYLVIFDDLEYFFPARRKRGKWTVWCDLSYFDDINENPYKSNLLDDLSPFVTIEDYNNYAKDMNENLRYIELPIERSVCIRTHTLYRNQRFGLPWNVQAIKDIKHKEKLKNLEKIVANKVINAVAVLTLGLKDSETSTYVKLGEQLTKSIFNNVKKGLSANKEGEASVVGLPEFAKLEYPQMKSDALDPKKFEPINSDIGNDTGIARTLTNGQGGNFATGNLNLDIVYRRISELLEKIESEVYNKLFALILPPRVANDYYLEYKKNTPLKTIDKLKMFKELHAMGYSLRPIIEILGEDFNEYVNNSISEIKDMKLRETIIPPVTSYTMSQKDMVNGNNGGKPVEEGSENPSTIKTKEHDGNNSPKPSV